MCLFFFVVFFLMSRRPPRSTQSRSSAASDVYKRQATRKPMPDDLVPQVPLIKDVVRGFSICVLEKQGTEADDLIGTLTIRAGDKGWRTVIISGDKDLLQLVNAVSYTHLTLPPIYSV